MKPTELRKLPEALLNSKISVLLPLYNEQEVIVQNVASLLKDLQKMGASYEVILVDDGSADQSYELLTEAYKDHPQVKVIQNYQNFGKGWALKTAYEFSSGEYVLFLDSDLELSIWHLPNFFNILLEKKADVVIGSKNHKDSMLEYPGWRKFLSMGYYTLVKIFFGLPIQDSQTGIKLFKREALEQALPRMLVKKFAFDIELLLIIHKQGFKIVPAPVELHFSRGGVGNIRLKSVYLMAKDTLSIFYRDRILRFYNRPFGQNKQYRYHLLLFQKTADDVEMSNLEKFLQISYSDFKITVLGPKKWQIKHPRLHYFVTDATDYTLRLKEFLQKNPPSADYKVFFSLNAYVDKRFLFPAARILNQNGVGAIGGFLSTRRDASDFEQTAWRVLGSPFINLDMGYRYRPSNYRKVDELSLDGFFIRSDLLAFENVEGKETYRLEAVLSALVRKKGWNLYYTPDLLFYKQLPDRGKKLRLYFAKRAVERVRQFQNSKHFSDWKFLIGLVYLLFVTVSLTAAVILKDWRILVPLLGYYFLMLIHTLFFVSLGKGLKVFGWLVILQFVYSWSVLKAFFKKKTK